MLKALLKEFIEIFNQKQAVAFFAPGRVNLIGEHTDYNGGHVLPCAITLGTYCLASLREDDQIRLYSKNFAQDGIIIFDLHQTDYDNKHGWANYPKGIIKYLKENGHIIHHGVDLFFYGNIPNGAGLSSSASIELLTGVVFEKLFALSLQKLELIGIGKRVENEFIGVNSGIMDQFAISKGEKDKAILLNCNTLKYEMVPLRFKGQSIVIMNTNKRRELANSSYNQRREECEQALDYLKKELDISALCEIDVNIFSRYERLIPDTILKKRARHVISENQRTIRAAKALKNQDLSTFASLVNRSHISLRDDYQVSCIELDILVEAAWKEPGILAARMTGAGFGGCAIAIVENDKISSFTQNIGKIYRHAVGYDADFYTANTSDGAKYLKDLAIS